MARQGTERSAGELYGVQMLRAVAALGVVVHHTLEQSDAAAGRFSPDWLTTAGASGVDIFFVISGFILLYVSFSGATPGAAAFLTRRLQRIYPIYWVCCAVMLGIYLAGFWTYSRLSFYDLVASFVLLPSPGKMIGVSWTLVYEMYFYVIFSGMLLFRSRNVSVVGCSVAIFGFLWLAHVLPEGVVGEFLIIPIPVEFCFGLGLAWIFLRWSEQGKAWPRWAMAGFLGLGVLLASPVFVAHSSTIGLPHRVVVWGIPALFIVAASLGVGRPRFWFTRFLVVLGDASYALYLTHEFLMSLYGWAIRQTWVGRVDQVFVVPVVIGLSVGLGVAAHFWVERPLIAGIRRLGAGKTEVKKAVLF